MKTFIILLTFLWGSALFAVEGQERTAYLDPIDELLPSTPPQVDMSCPIGKLDVMIHQGIAFWRLTLQAHNNTQNLESAFLRFPLPEDTLVSRFRIWDQGKLYEGTIGPRKKAEKIYRKVSGDTVPDLDKLEEDRQQREIRKRDPGLARQSGRLFELRVAPILPGETKQVQLFGHRRLPSTEAGFNWRRELRPMARLQHPSLGDLPCLDFKVTVDIIELGGLQSLHSIDADLWDVTRLNDQHSRASSISLNGRNTPRVDWVIKPDITAENKVWGVTSQVGDDQRFLLRLHRDGAKDVDVEPIKPFYIGCWRFEEVKVTTPTNLRSRRRSSPIHEDRFQLETSAYITLFNLCRFSPGQKFWTSYHVKTRANQGTPYYGDFSLTDTDFDKFSKKLFESRPQQKTKHSGIDIMKHLNESIGKGIEDVMLFVDFLDPKTYRRLKQLSQQARFLVFCEDRDWSLESTDGLTLIDLKTIGDEPDFLNPNGFENHDTFYLRAFRPFRGPIIASGEAKVDGLRIERIGGGFSPWIWVSGNIDKKGDLALTLSPPEGGFLATDSWHRFDLHLEKLANGGLWGGSFAARTQIHREMSTLTTQEREALSRTWSFLTPETAFIALPGDLERRFGFAPETRSDSDHMGGSFGAGTPEPHEWAIILILTSLLAYKWKQQRKLC